MGGGGGERRAHAQSKLWSTGNTRLCFASAPSKMTFAGFQRAVFSDLSQFSVMVEIPWIRACSLQLFVHRSAFDLNPPGTRFTAARALAARLSACHCPFSKSINAARPLVVGSDHNTHSDDALRCLTSIISIIAMHNDGSQCQCIFRKLHSFVSLMSLKVAFVSTLDVSHWCGAFKIKSTTYRSYVPPIYVGCCVAGIMVSYHLSTDARADIRALRRLNPSLSVSQVANQVACDRKTVRYWLDPRRSGGLSTTRRDTAQSIKRRREIICKLARMVSKTVVS